jgi:hypothetical protein
MDVLVVCEEADRAVVELAPDPPQTPLDGLQLRGLEKASRGQPARMGDAAGDVVRIQLEIDLERRRETLELGQEPARETAAPELAAYGVSLFTSPNSPFNSRSCSRPWT